MVWPNSSILYLPKYCTGFHQFGFEPYLLKVVEQEFTLASSLHQQMNNNFSSTTPLAFLEDLNPFSIKMMPFVDRLSVFFRNTL